MSYLIYETHFCDLWFHFDSFQFLILSTYLLKIIECCSCSQTRILSNKTLTSHKFIQHNILNEVVIDM